MSSNDYMTESDIALLKSAQRANELRNEAFTIRLQESGKSPNINTSIYPSYTGISKKRAEQFKKEAEALRTREKMKHNANANYDDLSLEHFGGKTRKRKSKKQKRKSRKRKVKTIRNYKKNRK